MKVECAHDKIVPIKDLKPNPKNRNEHTDQQIKLLAKIMKINKVRNPIVVSNQSGFMTKGHGRLMAAKLNGWTEFPVDFQDYETPELEYADCVADNEIAELSKTNRSLVLEDVLELGPDFDFDLLGVPDFKLPEDFKSNEDEVPDVPADDKRVKTGDLFILGDHRLLCADSTNIQHVERLMGGEKADMVFTDPPYGIDYDAQSSGYTGAKNFGKIQNDEKAPDLNLIFSMNMPTVIFGANNFPEILPHRGRWLVWDKRSDSTEDKAICDGAWGSQVEIAWCNKKTGINRIFRVKHGGFVNRDGGKREHPTQKPTKLICDILESEKSGAKVLDLFGGSGSTLIACEKTNRKCFMMELDPHYCSVILDRWAKFTGKDPLREDGTKWSNITPENSVKTTVKVKKHAKGM